MHLVFTFCKIAYVTVLGCIRDREAVMEYCEFVTDKFSVFTEHKTCISRFRLICFFKNFLHFFSLYIYIYIHIINIHRWLNMANITPPDDVSVEPKRYSVDFLIKSLLPLVLPCYQFFHTHTHTHTHTHIYIYINNGFFILCWMAWKNIALI